MGPGPMHPFWEFPGHRLRRRKPGHRQVVPADRPRVTEGKAGGSGRVPNAVGFSLARNGSADLTSGRRAQGG